MNVVIINDSPQKKGTVATLLRAVEKGLSEKHKVEWINVFRIQVKALKGCLKKSPLIPLY